MQTRRPRHSIALLSLIISITIYVLSGLKAFTGAASRRYVLPAYSYARVPVAFFALSLVFLLSFSTNTLAATRTVCASGCDFTAIQTAISDAGTVDGDTILVSDGTYSENIDYGGKNITVQSVNGAALTKIQGTGGASAVVSFISGETASAVIDGFTIDNQGSGADRRGIKITTASTPTIRNSIIEGNSLSTMSGGDPNYGAGIYINGGGVTIEGTTIGQSGKANAANKGSGIYATVGLDITISNSTISYNSGRDYAGIHLSAMTGAATLTNTNVVYNSAGSYQVGGIYANASSISITGGSISNNTGVQGAGLRLENVPTVTIINGVTIDSNMSSGQIAGGIYSIDSPMTITGGSISSNSSRDGAGIYLTGGYAGFSAGTKTTIDGTTISNNNANGYNGGGILSSGSPLDRTNAAITFNSGKQGSGLRLLSLPLVTVITNTNIDDNTGGAINGGAIYADSSPLAITGGTISRNTGSRDGGGIYLAGNYSAYPAGTKTTINGTTIDGNSSSGYAGGGIYSNTLPIAFSNATISNNSGGAGGGLYLNNIGVVTIFDNVTISGNAGAGSNHGGGIYSTGSPLSINNSNITGNTVPRQGAGIFISGLYADVNTITNSTINGNIAGGGYNGGGIYTDRALQVDYTYVQGNRGGPGGKLFWKASLERRYLGRAHQGGHHRVRHMLDGRDRYEDEQLCSAYHRSEHDSVFYLRLRFGERPINRFEIYRGHSAAN